MTLPYIEPCACCQVLTWYPLSVHFPVPRRSPQAWKEATQPGCNCVCGLHHWNRPGPNLGLPCLVLSCLDLTCLFLSSSARISSTFQSLGLVSFLHTSDPSFPGFPLLFQLFPFSFRLPFSDSLSFSIPPLPLPSQTSWCLQLQLGT